jgi:hypothetical protein
MKKIVFLQICLWCLAWPAGAQTIGDAIRYSNFEFGSSGRALGAGSAFSALGADVSLIGANPAGLAAFRRSEFSFTPGIFIQNTSALLQGAGATDESKGKFNISSAGLVLSGHPSAGKWKTFNFGIGFNQLANYNQKFYFEGETKGTITDRWLEMAQGTNSDDLDQFEAGLAYATGALIPTADDGVYLSDFVNFKNQPIGKSQSYESKGATHELAFSLAGNYDEKIFAGLALGVPFVRFEENKTYSETDEKSDKIPAFNSLEYQERLRTVGAGINLKLGLIYRVNQMLRLGVGVHSPTLIGLNDSYSTRLTYDYTDQNNNGPIDSESPEGTFEYSLTTPWRISGSAGVLFGKNGFASIEAEWVDHSTTAFNFDTDQGGDLSYERDLNKQIAQNLGSAINLRGGAEFAFEIFRLRAGGGLLGSPFGSDGDPTTYFSAGFGIREKNFFLDLGYRRSFTKETYVPYLTEDAPTQVVQNDISTSQVLLTLGFKI